MRIVFGPGCCGALDEASKREWLVTDGLGGYAMGTVGMLRTRCYHGLLVVAARGPSERMLGLVALDPVLVVGDTRWRLATHEWADGAVDPRGHELLALFELDRGIPRWRWQVGDVVLERELAMAHGRPTVGIVHRLVRADRPVRLELTPLCTWRNVHGSRYANGDPSVRQTVDGFLFENAYRVAGTGYLPGGAWYRGIRAREEAARGLNDREDVWAAGMFAADLDVGGCHEVVASAAQFDSLPSATGVVRDALERGSRLLHDADATDEIDAQLVLAADQFAITTSGRSTAVAGYPWFGEWSRDLMTSYEGLYLCTGRAQEGREVLRSTAATLSQGMLANTADTGALEYNTIDGTLWFPHALGRHLDVTGDVDLGDELAPVVEEIVTRHIDGTRYEIAVDPRDHLLGGGTEGWALTWMDARCDGVPMTPRIGKPVEVNALWVQALRLAAQLAESTSRRERWSAIAARAASSFVSRFVRADGHGLLDVVDGPGGDSASVRPNQLLAVSLPDGPFDVLGPRRARAIVDVCRTTLLTPLGLRSLSPDDASYRPYHRGSPAERDAAYHQGTVWPWLLGPYVDAAFHAGVPLAGVLDSVEAHLTEWGLGSISETTDGAAPHAATGCPFQAWSVAEVLRIRRASALREAQGEEGEEGGRRDSSRRIPTPVHGS